jgi:hypothetical protein
MPSKEFDKLAAEVPVLMLKLKKCADRRNQEIATEDQAIRPLLTGLTTMSQQDSPK